MTDKVNLFDSDSSEEEVESELKINKQYANIHDQRREKELLQRYKDLQEEVSSSSSESDDFEDPEFDDNFFRVISLLKGKDPKILDKNFVAFPEQKPKEKTKAKKSKPTSINDYQRQIMLENNGDVDEEESKLSKKKSDEAELDKLKSAIMDDDDEDSEDCIKSFAPSSDQKPESETIKFLRGDDVEIPEDKKKDLSYLRSYWNDPNLDEGESFLKDFFLNKRYLEKDNNFKIMEELDKLSEEEKFENEQEQFEHKYNFRFEEPDPEFIKRYPRTVGESLRRKDSKRKEKREEYSERKQREKEQKREELKLLKALKRNEIEEKFFKLQEVTGKEDINFDEEDIESDFDPEKHDRKMKELFDEDYYTVEEQQKPVFQYDEEIDDEDWNHWSRSDNPDVKEEPDDDVDTVEDFNADDDKRDVDNRTLFMKEMIERTKDRKRNRRKKSMFAELLADPKPLFDPEGKSFDEYLDEYYKLDCEDVVSGMPVRYKYREVVPNDFGLSVDEILKADDKDLNRWCSLKKTCQYRKNEEEIYDLQAFKKKALNPALKQKILTSLFAKSEEENSEADVGKAQDSDQKKKKKRKKKKNKREINLVETEPSVDMKVELEDECEDRVNQNPKNQEKVKKEKLDSDEKELMTNAEELNTTTSTVGNDSFTKSKRKRKKSKKNRNENSGILSPETLAINIKSESNVGETSKRKAFDVDKNGDFPPHSLESNTHRSKKIKTEPLNSQDVSKNLSINETTAGESSSKKRKRKRSKKKSNGGEQRFNKPFFSANKNPKLETDKRLSLPDERLAAYGLNPKKFKSKIIYSKRT